MKPLSKASEDPERSPQTSQQKREEPDKIWRPGVPPVGDIYIMSPEGRFVGLGFEAYCLGLRVWGLGLGFSNFRVLEFCFTAFTA